MNRRQFLEVVSLSGLSVSLGAGVLCAQEISEEEAEPMEELDILQADQIDWQDGFSLDQGCTFRMGLQVPIYSD